jgi:hypothetical protein
VEPFIEMFLELAAALLMRKDDESWSITKIAIALAVVIALMVLCYLAVR